MSDLDKFVSLYKEVGIDVAAEKDQDRFIILLVSGAHPKLSGYIGYCTEIHFDLAGKFLEQKFY